MLNYLFLNKKPLAKESCREADLPPFLDMIEPVCDSKLMECGFYVQST